MKAKFLFVIAFLSASFSYAQKTADSVERHVDKFPEFNYKPMQISDSIKAKYVVQLFEYLKEKTSLPLIKPGTKPVGKPGLIMLSFIVDKDGAVSKPRTKFTNYDFEAEKINKILEGMPKWVPAVKNGQNVGYRCFSLYYIKKDEQESPKIPLKP